MPQSARNGNFFPLSRHHDERLAVMRIDVVDRRDPVVDRKGRPSVTGTLKGYINQKLNAGDVLIVGPGEPHSPGDFTEPTKIIRVVIDPHKVMPLVPPS